MIFPGDNCPDGVSCLTFNRTDICAGHEVDSECSSSTR